MIWAGYGLDFATLATAANTSTGTHVVQPTPTLNPAALLTSGVNLTTLAAASKQQQAQAAAQPTVNFLQLMQAQQSYASPRTAPTSGPDLRKQKLLDDMAQSVSQMMSPGTPAVVNGGNVGGQEVQNGIAQVCVSQGGMWDVDGCLFPDGAKVGVDQYGQVYCMNYAGSCAGGQAVASKGIGGAALIGAAALAALFFLR